MPVRINYRGDAMDEYLMSLALFRKPVAKDETSLFRAASEQIYSTQKFYAELQQCCVAYIERHAEKFENLNQVKAYIRALALIYKRDFLIYQEIAKPPVNVTNYGFPRKVILCESFGNHFDCVYPRTFQQKAAICQSMVYELLYKGIFHMDADVEAAVGLIRRQNVFANRNRSSATASVGMYSPPVAHNQYLPAPPLSPYRPAADSNTACKASYLGPYLLNTSADTSFTERDLNQPISYNDFSPPNFAEEYIRNRQRQMAVTGPPFPYKVAKALDPVVYRNIEYDVWMDERKARFRAMHRCLQMAPFPPGSSCLVRLDDDDCRLYHGVVQQVLNNSDMVVVYIKELGEKKRVHCDRLEALPRNATSMDPYTSTPPPMQQHQQAPQNWSWSSSLSSGDQTDTSPTQTYQLVTTHANETQVSSAPQPIPTRQCVVPPPPTMAVAPPVQIQQSMPVAQPNYVAATWPGSGNAMYTDILSQSFQAPPHVNGGTLVPMNTPNVPQPTAIQVPSPTYIYSQGGAMTAIPPQPSQIIYPYLPVIGVPYFDLNSGPVNYSGAVPSADARGSDLPWQDVPTLRYFFNLGCEYFRQYMALQQQSSLCQYQTIQNAPMISTRPPTYYAQPSIEQPCYENEMKKI